MGVINRDNALYMATVIDNSGLDQGLKDSEKKVEQFAKVIEKISKTTDLAFDGNSLKEFKENIDAQRKSVELLENQYKQAKQALDNLGSGDDGKIFSNEEMKKAATEYNQAKKLLSEVKRELDLENKALEKKEAGYKAVSVELDKLKPKQITYMTQLRNIKEEMMRLESAGQKESSRYKELEGELEKVGTAYRKVNQQQKLLTTAGNATLAGIVQGVAGLSGAFSAGHGVASLFVKDNEKLAAIQTKLQAAMSITIGLQQVSSTLHSSSNFKLGLVKKATDAWTISQKALNTSLGIGAGLSKALLGGGILALGAGIIWLISHYNTWNKAQKETARLNKIVTDGLKEAAIDGEKAASKEQVALDLLYRATQNETKAKEERLKAAEALQKQYPDYLGNLSKEEILAGKGAAAYNKLSTSIVAASRARAAADKITENQSKALDLEIKRQDKMRELSDANLTAAKNSIERSNDYRVAQAQEDAQVRFERRKEELSKEIGQINRELDKTNELSKRLADTINVEDLLFNANTDSSKKYNVPQKTKEYIKNQIDLFAKIALERARANEDLENQATQARINAMEEGFEKEEELRAHNNKLELLALDRQKEDYIRAYIQAEREKFDAAEELALKRDTKYKKRVFDASGIVVDTSVFNDIRKDIESKHASYPQLLAEQEAKDWDEYLIQFGSYQEKRQAIINKFNREMDDAQTQGKKDTLYENMQNQLDELDNSIKNSATLMGQLFADSSQKSVTEIQAVIDKAKLLMQYIESVKDEQGNAIIGGKTISKNDILGLGISDQTLKNLNLSTQELEALRNAINKLQGELGAKSPFLLLKSQISDATNKIKQGKIVQGITELGAASSQFSPAIAQFGQDLGNIIGDEKLGDDISKIVEGIGGLGETAAGVGQIMSGDIVGGSMAAVSGISKVVGAMEGLFGADYSRYNKMKEEYEKLNSIWDELIDKKKEYIKTSFGPEAYKVGKEAEELTQKAIENYRTLGRERLNAGASAGSHSIGIRQWKRVTREDLRQAEEALGDAWKKEYGEKGRMTWLFDLSADDLSNLKEAGTFWAHLDDDVRGYLDSIIDGQERIEDINNSIQEQLTQVSFDSVRDSFIDTLLDMSSDAEDFADNFTQYMQRAILNAQIADLMDDELKKWYADFADANNNKGGMSDSDYTKLQNQWKDIVDKGLDMREKLKDAFDWEVSDDRTSTAKGVATASQDSVDYLNGMMTISVEHTRQILGFTGNIVEQLKLMNASHKEILGVCNYILEHTRNIDKNTANMRDDISKMRKDIFTLTQGITLKK